MSATVHVWTIDLDEEPGAVSSLLDVLSGEERVRAARFRTTELRLRFIVAHGALRHILSGYIGIPPGQVSLRTTDRASRSCRRVARSTCRIPTASRSAR